VRCSARVAGLTITPVTALACGKRRRSRSIPTSFKKEILIYMNSRRRDAEYAEKINVFISSGFSSRLRVQKTINQTP
jgi:hypothetical protein